MSKFIRSVWDAVETGQFNYARDQWEVYLGGGIYGAVRFGQAAYVYKQMLEGKRWFEASPLYPISRNQAAYIFANFPDKARKLKRNT